MTIQTTGNRFIFEITNVYLYVKVGRRDWYIWR